MDSQHNRSMASNDDGLEGVSRGRNNSIGQRFIILYMLNFALLFTHEIDSAYWQEWKLFGIPGGIQVFLALNFGLLLVALYGFARLLMGKRDGYFFSLLLAAGGLFAFGIHSYFLLTGHPEFRLPASISLLVVMAPVSVLQIWVTLEKMRQDGR